MKLFLGNFATAIMHYDITFIILLLQNFSNTPILKCHWLLVCTISHKTAQVKGPDWLKTSQTGFSQILCDMSPAPVITVNRLVDLLNQAIHTAD